MNGNAENAVLLLPETLDLAASESFLDMVRGRAGDEVPLRMDASEVRTLTLPCAQIVLAALRGGEGITIRNPSSAFTGAFDDLGLDWMSYLDTEPSTDTEAAATQADDNKGQPDDAARPADDAGISRGLSGSTELHSRNENVMNTRILTIDDSKTMRDMLMLTLAGAGFDVIQAVDGQDGLDVLASEQVDVIITDINMPRMDGYEVIRNLRRNPEHKATPILVLTTESENDKKNLAREAGATGWMVKPFDPDRLVATVRKVAPVRPQ
jgi:two-component system chemotaxis response regulator CheY